MYPILIEWIDEESPAEFLCKIGDGFYWLPRTAIRPIIDGVRCIDGKGPVLGECNVSAEIPFALAQEKGLVNRPRAEPALPTQPCRVCGARIMWAKTVNGKSIPIDAEPVEYGGNVVLRAGAAVMLKKDEPSGADEKRYLAHFVTCAKWARKSQSTDAAKTPTGQRKAAAAIKPATKPQPDLFGGDHA